MPKRIKSLENRIENRKNRIKNHQERIKIEKEGIKKDEQSLIHLKYDDVIQKMMKYDIDSEVIKEAIEENINKEQDTPDTKETDSIKNNNDVN